jgi:hypothetical protein
MQPGDERQFVARAVFRRKCARQRRSMNDKERVQQTLARQPVDRIPIGFFCN